MQTQGHESSCPASSIVDPEDLWRYRWLLLAIGTLLVVPLWTVHYLPLVDFSEHLARAWILKHYSDVPIFSGYYRVNYSPVPNLAVDLGLPLLLSWFSPTTAAKVFVSLLVVTFVLGCHLLGKAIHGRPTWLAAVASFFIYNSLFFYGFINCMVSVALFLLAAALLLHLRRRVTLFKAAALTLLAAATFLAHLSGFFFLAATTCALAAVSFLRTRGITRADFVSVATILPTLAVYVAADRADASVTTWNSISGKVQHSLIFLLSYNPVVDAAVAGIVLLAVVSVLYSGRARVAVEIGAVAALFGALFIVFPSIYHTGEDADTRMLIPAVLIAVLGVSISAPKWIAKATLLAVIGVSAFRVGEITYYWHSADILSEAQIGIFKELRTASRVYPIVWLPRERVENKIHRHLQHLAGYATVYRNAVNPTTFTFKGLQPIELIGDLPYKTITASMKVSEVDWQVIFAKYDYLWVYGVSPEYRQFLQSNCRLIAQDGQGGLYRIDK